MATASATLGVPDSIVTPTASDTDDDDDDDDDDDMKTGDIYCGS